MPFGRYGIESRLGRGGMGEVFLAVVEGAGGFRKKVVIKRMLPELARDGAFVERFLAEGRLVVQLQHPHIVQVLDMAEEEGEFFIAMEFVDGWDLGRVLESIGARGEAMPLPLSLVVLTALAEALDHAHRATDEEGAPLGIVHRDVSPSNVMLGRQGAVKLLDFGIAAARGEGGGGGKVAYAAPEVLRGEGAGVAADLFAFGVVAVELLTGQHPFRGRSELETADRIQHEAPRGLEALDAPRSLETLLRALVAKEEADRPGSAGEVVRALRAVNAELGALLGSVELGAWLRERLEDEGATGAALGFDALLGLGLGRQRPERTVTRAMGAGGKAPAERVVPVEGGEVSALSAEVVAEVSSPPEGRARRPWALGLIGVGLGALALWVGMAPAGEVERGPEQTTLVQGALPPAVEREGATVGTETPDVEAESPGEGPGAELWRSFQDAVRDVQAAVVAEAAEVSEPSGTEEPKVRRPRRAEVRAPDAGPPGAGRGGSAPESGLMRVRILPASARARLEGPEPRLVRAGEIVELALPAGPHTLVVEGDGVAALRRRFQVAAGETTNLRTIMLEGKGP